MMHWDLRVEVRKTTEVAAERGAERSQGVQRLLVSLKRGQHT